MGQTNNRIDQAIRYRPIIDYINKNQPKKILEIGSGSQWIWRFLDIKFDWLDLSKNDYQESEQKIWSKMNFIYWSAINIPIKDNTYDFVFSCDMLEHIPKKDREKVFSEAIRICKKWCVIFFWFPCWFFWKICDRFLFHLFWFLNIINPKIYIPKRLTEHINIEYPTNKEIKYLIMKISNKHQIDTKEIQEYNYDNILLHLFFLLFDISMIISRLQFSSKAKKVHKYFIDKYLDTKLCLTISIFPYRKYIIIKK